MNLTFEAETHTYRLDGAVVPSVTQLLERVYEGVYANIPAAILERKSAIGTAVHLATELIDADDLDESSVDPVLVPYLDAYREFLAAEKPQWTMSETPLAHPLWRYAGTLDRAGILRDEHSIIDIKTVAQLHPAIGVQVAAYDLLHQHHISRPTPAKRYALQLKPDGTYRLKPYADPDDYRVFLALVSVYNWVSKHGN